MREKKNTMGYEELFDTMIASEDVKKTISDTLAISPLEALEAERTLRGIMEEKHEEILAMSEETRKSAWRMNLRYLEYLRMHYAYISMVHPMMTVGKDRICAWRKTVEEYEALFDGKYPLVTLVTKESAKMVRHLIPREYLDLMDNPDRFILAATRFMGPDSDRTTDKDYVVPAGVLSFVIQKDDEDRFARIEWIYTDEEYRGYHIADALLCEMFYMLKDADIAAVIADVEPRRLALGEGTPEDSVDPLSEMFSKWKFTAGLLPASEILLPLSEILESDGISKRAAAEESVGPLSALSDVEFKRAATAIITKNPNAYDSRIAFAGRERYDMETSCFYRKDGAVTGLFLVMKNHFGELEIVLGAGSDKAMLAMGSFAALAAEKRYAAETVVKLPIRGQYAADYVAENLSAWSEDILVRMLLLAPLPDEDITTEEWEAGAEVLAGQEWQPYVEE